jgi:uncharacterized protein
MADEPWRELNMSRATYFRKKAKGELNSPVKLAVNNIEPIRPKRIPMMALDLARQKRGPTANPFIPRVLPPFVPQKLAMDQATFNVTNFAAAEFLENPFFDGALVWYGFGFYSTISTIPEINQICTTIAEEATKNWIKFTAVGDDKTDKIKELEAACKQFKLKDLMRWVCLTDARMGRAHVYVDLGKTHDSAELLSPIDDGTTELSRRKCKPGGLRGFVACDPFWVYPTGPYNSTDPLLPDFYKPQIWLAMARQLHISRLLTFVSCEVPDILKPAWQFSGISMAQRALQSVEFWRTARKHVSELLRSFTVFHLSTNLSATLQEGGEALFERTDLFNSIRDNQGLMLIDRETEQLGNISVPLGTLDALMAKFQEGMSSISRIPNVLMTGIQPAGLNASSAGELEAHYGHVYAYQENFLRPNLQILINFIMLHLWGELDTEIQFEFNSIQLVDDQQAAAIELTRAQAHQIYVDSGAVAPEEVREALAMDPSSDYENLDIERVPEMSSEEAAGMLDPGEEHQHGLEDEEDGQVAEQIPLEKVPVKRIRRHGG